MKNNSIFIMFLVVLAFTVVFALIVRVCIIDRHAGDDLAKKEDAVIAEHEKKQEIITEDAMKKYEDATRISAEHVERTTIEGAEGFDTEYNRYIISDIDLSSQTDDTRDYHEALLESDGEIGEGAKVSFADAFGISYADMDGRSLYESLLKQCGFGTEFNDVRFDEKTNELTGQELYVYNGNCDVTDHLMEGEICDKIVEKKVCYQLGDETDGVKLPEYFSASVTYKAGNQVITKSLYLSVLIEKSDEGKEVADA